MKTKSAIYRLFLFGLLLAPLFNCKKEAIKTAQPIALAPVLTTTDLSAITNTTAASGGNITNDGGAAVTARGVCWSINQNPTTANSKTTDGEGTGTFTSNLTGLLHGTIYYVKAYAANSIGTTYGNQVSLTTIKNPLLGSWLSATNKQMSFDEKGVISIKIGNNVYSYTYIILNDSTYFMGGLYYWFQILDINLKTRNYLGVTDTYKKVP